VKALTKMPSRTCRVFIVVNSNDDVLFALGEYYLKIPSSHFKMNAEHSKYAM